MKIEEALEPTGRASDHRDKIMYAALDEKGVLCWYDIETHELINPVGLDSINGSGWQPYHEVKEIKPEVRGELWETKSGLKVFVCRGNGGELILKREDGFEFSLNNLPKGLTRLFPIVEDDNVERITVKRVKWRKFNGMTLIYPSSDSRFDFASLIDSGRMKMILETYKV